VQTAEAPVRFKGGFLSSGRFRQLRFSVLHKSAELAPSQLCASSAKDFAQKILRFFASRKIVLHPTFPLCGKRQKTAHGGRSFTRRFLCECNVG
jgi:hypothetical protein